MKWRITGRVRADVRVEASPETAFAFLAASDQREHGGVPGSSTLVRSSAHTTSLMWWRRSISWARILAPMPRISRTIRFGLGRPTYTIIATTLTARRPIPE